VRRGILTKPYLSRGKNRERVGSNFTRKKEGVARQKSPGRRKKRGKDAEGKDYIG